MLLRQMACAGQIEYAVFAKTMSGLERICHALEPGDEEEQHGP